MRNPREPITPGLHPPPPPSTPRLAPWDHVDALCNRIDELIEVMRAYAPMPPGAPSIEFPEIPELPEWPGWKPVTTRLDNIKEKLDEIKTANDWIAKETEEIFRRNIRTADTFYSSMSNWTNGKRIRLKVTSSLNQDVTVQVIGNINNATDGAADIEGLLFICPADDSITIGLDWDDWHPYIGVRITVATAPTKGTLFGWSVIQE